MESTQNTQALADLLDDLTQQELTDLIFYCWVNKSITRGEIKGFRKSIGKSNSEEMPELNITPDMLADDKLKHDPDCQCNLCLSVNFGAH